MKNVSDQDYRIFIALYIEDNLKKITATPTAITLIKKFIHDILSANNGEVYIEITDADISNGAELMLLQYYDILKDYRDKMLREKNRLERFAMKRYFNDYNRTLEELKDAVEDLCQNQIKVWQ